MLDTAQKHTAKNMSGYFQVLRRVGANASNKPRYMNRLLISIVLSVAAPAQVFAWGSEGHRVVAEIAEQYLEPTTARQVRNLLAIENETALSDVANWADQIRHQRRFTASWHFVDIPISVSAYNRARDCQRDACVVEKIKQFAGELQNRRLSPRERLEALKFVVHFVGDIHQPLHASDNGDRGGNEVRVRFLGRRTNLHAVWDTGILAAAVNGDERAYALHLTHGVTPAQISVWQKGTPEQWANESHAVAVKLIYGELPHGGTLSASYEEAVLPIVNQQLEKAGVRLAEILNTVLGE